MNYTYNVFKDFARLPIGESDDHKEAVNLIFEMDSMVSPDAPDFFRVPGVKVRTPRNEVGQSPKFRHELPDNTNIQDIKNDERYKVGKVVAETREGYEKNKGRFLSSTMTSLVQQDPLPKGEERIHSVLFPNKMSHEQALVIDKFGDGLRYIERAELEGTAQGGSIRSIRDITGGRKIKR